MLEAAFVARVSRIVFTGLTYHEFLISRTITFAKHRRHDNFEQHCAYLIVREISKRKNVLRVKSRDRKCYNVQVQSINLKLVIKAVR